MICSVPSLWPWAVGFVSALLLVSPAEANPPLISFPPFPANSCDPGGLLRCMQNSSVRNGYIDLLPDKGNGTDPNLLLNNIGRVLYHQQAITWPASFDTNFTVLISKRANASSFGDGMAFVMTAEMRQSPPGSFGGFLGLFDHSTNGNTTGQLAVEIDTYPNEYETQEYHVGVDIASIVSNVTAPLSSVSVDLNKEIPVTYRVNYDGWTKNLEVSAGYAGEGPPKSLLNFCIVIAKINPIYVGFTAGSGPSSNYSENIRILSWNFSFTPLPDWSLEEPGDGKGGRRLRTILAIVVSTVVGVPSLVLLILLGAKRVRKWRRWRWLESLSRSAASAPKMYTYEKLSTATRCFSSANLLGKGGFGSVYRGNFSNPPSVVAVKRISATSKQGEREYFAEICTIGRLHHKNIVQLQGWCHSGKSLLLVYEFMPNGSLDRHITAGTLDWPTRHRILLGLASALLYLHEECGGTVVHRDVKPNNVLLDADFEAHLGDFGLARLAQGTDRTTSTTVLAGTIGYLAPEYGYTGKATPESDVFSYGVVVLEVVCGRRSLMGLDDNNLLDHVWELYTSGKLLQAVDPRLESQFDEEEVRRTLLVGLMCSHPNPASRPRSRQVVQILGNPSEPLMEMPESRPDTIIPSPSMMDFSFEIVSIMSTSTTMPMGASPDSTKSSLLLAR
ncbi:unnamed protein product [Spirodela intermedia]|uniref:non-specific serine/threonine protein kinase n=1 Tax=Spirodela intermedia TaxID=51605 RepID=A0A7I8L1X0_SPIIN|nr:unnamed protein product [Spirodela intermedia]